MKLLFGHKNEERANSVEHFQPSFVVDSFQSQ